MTIDEAIKEIETIEDWISRQTWLLEDWCKTTDALDKAIKALEQEPKTGHWIVDEYGIKHCPFCNAINNTVYDSYCANCGAKNGE